MQALSFFAKSTNAYMKNRQLSWREHNIIVEDMEFESHSILFFLFREIYKVYYEEKRKAVN